MKGLELAEKYFNSIVAPGFKSVFPELYNQMAFGLVGAGSECYGYDDELSRDHDWGPRVCVWVPDDLYRRKGPELQQVYDSFPGECCGFSPVQRIDTAVQRDGIISIERFYARFLGIGFLPEKNKQWLALKDEQLSQCTNGKVFLDNLGRFTAYRHALQSYYPRDVWLKKIVARCVMISQHGQYNLQRALYRQDTLAAEHSKAQFCNEVTALAFLLRKSYRPFYKWQYKALRELDDFGAELSARLQKLYTVHACGPSKGQEQVRHIHKELNAEVEKIVSALFTQIMESPGLGGSLLSDAVSEYRKRLKIIQESNFLQNIGFEIQPLIEDKQIREGAGFFE